MPPRTAAAIIMAAVALAALAAPIAMAEKGKKYYETIYPCTKCHVGLKLTGNVKASKFHGINLTVGAHRGLFCSDCHKPPLMIELRGGSLVYIPGYHSEDLVRKTNSLCKICHPREYQDYMNLVHGNKTFTCSGGEVVIVKGYKNISYYFHVCPKGYYNLTTIPARACVECHDPHDPTFKPIPPLPTPSERPKPPPEEAIAVGNVAALIGSIILVAYGFILARGGRSG